MKLLLTSLLLLCLPYSSLIAQANEPYYVFYLHGQIMEGSKSDPISESYGRYEYSKIIETLQQRGYVVLSEVRAANTEPFGYAVKVSTQIDSLKKKGVKPDHITVIGASKGALIAMMASGLAKDKNVKYVLMGGCNEANQDNYQLDLYGQILSIYENSDPIGRSCKMIKKNSQGISKYKEIELKTYLKHGFIYRPIKEWVTPTDEWIQK